MNTQASSRAHACCSRLLFVLLFLLLIHAHLFAQTRTPASTSPKPKPSPTPTLERRFIKNILQDQKAIWTYPLRIRGDDARWLVPFAVSTAVLIGTDRRTAAEIRESDSLLRTSRNISRIGSVEALGGVTASFYLIGRARNDRRLKETGLLGAEALVDSLIVSNALKVVTERPRPFEDNGLGRFWRGGTSFPSGHAMNSWSVAAVIANEYGNHRFIKFSAYGLAALISVSRYTGQRHFLSDILVGGVIGYGIGRYVYRTQHETNIDSGDEFLPQRTRSKLFPAVTPGYDRQARAYGALFVWSF
jgi:membrane-associated phospholipid phosphatase